MLEDARQFVTAFIALGSNLGDREATIEAARTAMHSHPRIETIRCSPLLETEPIGPAGQGPYLNGATEIRTDLPPRELLDVLLQIERSLGRVRSETDARWGARTIDLDILLYADAVIEEPGLTIPHPRMHERRFVLEPLTLIAPNAVHPCLNFSVEELLSRLSTGAVTGSP